MTKASGTALGALAIACWSCYGVLVASNTMTPPFTAMAVVFTCASLTLLLLRLIRGQGLTGLRNMSPKTLALGFTGLFGSNCLYVLALAEGGKPVSVNIASLSWPLLMAMIIAGFGLAATTWLDALAMLLGFAGIIVLSLKEGDVALDWPILLALLGALSWAVYSAFRTRVPPGPQDSMLAFVATSALCCWLLVLLFERSSPPLEELLRLALVGMLPVGLANLAWDLGARHGDPVLLAGLSFLEPVASTALIAVILSQPVRPSDYAAMLLVLLAVLCSIMSERLRRKRSTPLQAG